MLSRLGDDECKVLEAGLGYTHWSPGHDSIRLLVLAGLAVDRANKAGRNVFALDPHGDLHLSAHVRIWSWQCHNLKLTWRRSMIFT